MVEGDDLFDGGSIADAERLLPGGMPPSFFAAAGVVVFIIGIGGIVYHNIGVSGQAEDMGVEFAVDVFGVGDVCGSVTVPGDTVSDGSAGMVKQRVFDGDAFKLDGFCDVHFAEE